MEHVKSTQHPSEFVNRIEELFWSQILGPLHRRLGFLGQNSE